MGEVLNLNKEEIKRLSCINDTHGHAWVLYLMLKKNMDIYTGLVQVENKILGNLLCEKLNLQELDYCYLVRLLINAEVILDYLSNQDTLSVKLPIALSDTCLESHWCH